MSVKASLIAKYPTVVKERVLPVLKERGIGDSGSSLDVTREYVRLYGAIPKTGASQKEKDAYQAQKAAIEAAMRLGTYVPPSSVNVNVYTLTTQRGEKTFEAADKAQAIRLAESAGLDVTDVKLKGTVELTPKQAAQKIRTARARGISDAAEALVTYGRGFTDVLAKHYLGKDYAAPQEGDVPIRFGGQLLYLPAENVDLLKQTDAFKSARGTTKDRLAAAYESSIDDFNRWLSNLKNEYPEYYATYQTMGMAGLEQIAQNQERIVNQLEPYKQTVDGKTGYCLHCALQSKAVTEGDLATVNFNSEDIKSAAAIANEWFAMESEILKEDKLYQAFVINRAALPGGVNWGKKGWDALDIEQKNRVIDNYATTIRPGPWEIHKQWALKHSIEPMLAITPVAGTIYFWDKMSPTWKGISIATDVLALGFIIRGAAAGARAARGYTAAARIKGALAGAGNVALAEMTAPMEFLARPLDVTKSVGRQLLDSIETVFHPRKIPLGSAELTYTTARLPIDDVGGAKNAMQLRDAVIDAIVHNKKATATVQGVTISLNPSQLQKVGGAMVIHATPDVRPYLNGAIIGGGSQGSGMFVSPNFHSRFATATSLGNAPKGGIPGGLIIRDETALKAIAPSGKTYLGAAEIEAVIRPGLTLPAPSQVLFTRDVYGNKLSLLVIGKPFTAAQVANLKFLGSVDTIAQIFKPTIQVSKGQAGYVRIDSLIDMSHDLTPLVRQYNAARAAGNTVKAAELQQRIAELEKKIEAQVRDINDIRTRISQNDVVFAEYTDKGLMERWQELNPRRASVAERYGTRVPDIEAGRGMTWASRLINYGSTDFPPYAPPYVPPNLTPPYVPTLYVPPTQIPPAGPPVIPPYYPPYEPPRIPPRVPPSLTKEARARITPTALKYVNMERVADALAGWRQGAYYVTIFPPFRTKGNKRDVVFSRHKPPWLSVAYGVRSPQKTLFTKGKLPPRISLDMGVTTAVVKNGKELHFDYN